VKLLKDATHFKVEQFFANDIIWFSINADDVDKFNEYRVLITYAVLILIATDIAVLISRRVYIMN
jgi:hypothetical protein